MNFIKSVAKKILGVPEDIPSAEEIELLRESNNLRMKSSPDGSDGCCYVIRRKGGGMFSILSSVLCHLDIAERAGMVPVVDFLNFKTIYNDGCIHGTANVWEYYFSPVSPLSLEEAYGKRCVLISDPGYPPGYDMSISRESCLYDVYDKYVRLNNDIKSEIDQYAIENFSGSKVLGIQFRGQEMRTAAGHWFPPTKKQIVKISEEVMSKGGYNKIFVVSEDAGHVEFLKAYFGDAVLYTKSYRTIGVNAYRQYPRDCHMYQLGREVIIDAFLLSKCDGLISCTSNVGEFARFVNHGKYEDNIQINNGPNSKNILLARWLWFIKKALPGGFGGFNIDINSKTFDRL